MSDRLRKIVQEGWRDNAKEFEDPRLLLRGAVSEMRGKIESQLHQFQNDSGEVNPPPAWIERHGDVETAKATIQKDFIEPFARARDILLQCLTEVSQELEALEEVGSSVDGVARLPTIEYLNQIGGPSNYVGNKVLTRAADKVGNREELEAILDNFGTAIFFHVSGWERFFDRLERRLAGE